jgi:hypothetical protein
MRFLNGLNPLARLVVVVVTAAIVVGVVGFGGYKVLIRSRQALPMVLLRNSFEQCYPEVLIQPWTMSVLQQGGALPFSLL